MAKILKINFSLVKIVLGCALWLEFICVAHLVAWVLIASIFHIEPLSWPIVIISSVVAGILSLPTNAYYIDLKKEEYRYNA